MFTRVDLRAEGVRIPVPATLVDISGGGCQLHARTLLKPHIAVEFDLPRYHAPPLRLGGELVKVSYTASDRTFRYGVDFDKLTEQTRDELARFIASEQKKSIAVAKRGEAHESKNVPQLRIQELRSAKRVEVNFPVKFTVNGSAQTHEGIALDVSTGGMRLISNQILRQEWDVVLRISFPSDALRAARTASGERSHTLIPFREIKVSARPLAGVKQTRGKYMQSLVWVNPDPMSTHEIARFVDATRLSR
jgi:c-di-GMP-binding flagellar brake protein YcgR